MERARRAGLMVRNGTKSRVEREPVRLQRHGGAGRRARKLARDPTVPGLALAELHRVQRLVVDRRMLRDRQRTRSPGLRTRGAGEQRTGKEHNAE
jgi:hypothetical protein